MLPVCMQSTPNLEFFSLTCRDLIDARVSMGLRPEFSASAMGTASRASAKARIAYCSSPGLYRSLSVGWWRRLDREVHALSEASSTAREHAISAAPPP